MGQNETIKSDRGKIKRAIALKFFAEHRNKPTIVNSQRLQLGFLNMAQLLTAAEIQAQAKNLSGWTVEGSTIQSQRKFQNFIQAIEFVNQLIEPAESAGHHPDIEISYNKVKITLTTHDAGGLTQKDFDLAAVISQIQ